MTKEILLKFADAWKKGDHHKIMSFFTDDCVYFSSIGKEPGTSYIGKSEVLKGVKNMISHDVVANVVLSNIRIYKNFGFWEWTYFLENGKIEIGCDVFEFEDKKIKLKNAFRKTSIRNKLQL